ncbi:MAG: protein-glutamate O-methyltransferase CheR [Planctomycetota bacterium]
MSLDSLQKFLEEAIGLDPEALGTRVVRASVQRRMRAISCGQLDVYAQMILNNAEEGQNLIQEVVIPETYFFRYPDSYHFITEHLLKENPYWLNRPVLKILSLPCSTGEEPYSIAIAMLNAGYSPQDFSIDAVDVSHRALNIARKATYQTRAFRNLDARKQLSYFDQSEGSFQLKAKPRASVRFHFGNLLDENYIPPQGEYDLVLCRNLLIYFSRENQTLALKKLAAMVKEDGVLMLGHGEAPAAPSDTLTPIRHPGAFAFRKKNTQETKPAPKLRAKKASPKKVMAAPKRSNAPTQASADTSMISLWRQAKQAADCGKLVEAVELCERDLIENGQSANTLFLLGLSAQSLGASNLAKHNFELALELDSNHYDALIALSFLTQREGDAKLASLLAARAALQAPADFSDAENLTS